MNEFNLRVQKIHKDAILPKYAHEGDAGLDLYSVEEVIIERNESALIKTGIKIELPKQTEAQVRPRSGLALKHGITVLNTPGTIDEGYRGEIGIILINHGKEKFVVEKGMKVAQMVVKPVWKVEVTEVNELSDTERSVGGFGSSGIR
ncbi:dUTP diphosphatase [Clostridium septicum]|uniref:Deoxyuridine 5'-triphosphate nucleotidohydrolase n=1 Tax=Clostridium septicum TaxID=1504 RepID=A0A9N7PI99_CLOSE|nr:dUTP diphosphatase [Clostridium septicum]AYE33495.1 dUTP diphosphatase [Clostridium septicum]MDU1315296.1 dUTP diphosphatase [Clostridium septicum]QAS61664.1 dUTP diphosphatase [Clostridium septicum]UEC21896.1 dUTP diphosphatase [Clostridium septicum]USS00073.1 dUTP diphosphatase [Clostridium septicum]